MNSPPDSRRFFYQTIADHFEGWDNPYDIRRRLEVVFDELLDGQGLQGKFVLDAGCGYGAFSRVLAKKGARIVSCDIAEKLVRLASSKYQTRGVVGDAIQLGFADNSFDLVITSEMIEHTLSPTAALHEMARVLKPGGTLILTTPNRVWQGVVVLASRLKLRPFEGIENFLGWQELERACAVNALEISAHIGFHPWPFQLKLWSLSQAVDKRFGHGAWARFMINQAILARKR
jgi:2-polyprenyl-6-hydroxyphenyl methylase/3-demethylubiquinone-9 3-methyltransferase